LNRNLQPGIHPDADQLSVFVEGAATAREQEKMLAHLAECAECRKAVFLMQPHEEPQRVTATREKGWMRRWLVPVGLPAVALACGLIAVLVYIRPHGSVPETPQQIASVKRAETERPGTTVAPTSNLEQGAPTANAGREARSGGRQNGFAAKGAATNLSRQESQIGSGLNLPTLKSDHATAGVAPQTTAAAPAADAAKVQGGIGTMTVSELPLNGRNVTELQQLQPADTKGAASQNTLARKRELPTLQIQGASVQAQTLAGISGRITDRSGAIIAGVTVTLHDAAGKTRQTTTGADGSFHLTQLQAGQYELTATVAGFKTSKQSIELKPSELATLQPVLDMGGASEAVEVEASSGAASVDTESANVSGQVVAEITGVGRGTAAPSGRPVAETVSHGKRFLSLDGAGNLFLSRNGGKKWKKVKPQWTGQAVRIEFTPAYGREASAKAKDETGAASEEAVFLLSTDGGTVWSSKDGVHWHSTVTSLR
jgi:Carboxypeptidase regulatory-like domain/Putative zinc-finger